MKRLITLYRSPNGYGWSITFGKRVRWNSRKATGRWWPLVSAGADEYCNRAVSFFFWPLGHLDVWWEPTWRTERCETCRAEARAEGICEWCGSRPCECQGSPWRTLIHISEYLELDEGWTTSEIDDLLDPAFDAMEIQYHPGNANEGNTP